MRFSLIKKILIVGIVWIIVASMLEIIFTKQHSQGLFFYVSVIGQCIFLVGLLYIDKRSKSTLSAYYAMLILISIAIYINNALESKNAFISLSLSLFFLFVLFLYLTTFSRISRIALFVRSFYMLVFCIVCGVVLLRFSTFIDSNIIVGFIVGLMIVPPLTMYVTAIFSLTDISLDSVNKTIK